MAEMIPNLSTCLKRMTSGEKIVFARLQRFLEDDYVCWFDIPLGQKRRYPDFVILHPRRGLLFLEVKDWKLETIKNVSHTQFTLHVDSGLKTCVNPIEQARQCTYSALATMQKDKALLQTHGQYKGKLVFPYGYGVVFTNITRKQLNTAIPLDAQEKILPPRLVMCKDELYDTIDAEDFQKQLWDMFNYDFNRALTLPEIDRIRWHMFPELRLNAVQDDWIDSGENREESMPDIINIMDRQQEKLAKNLGRGHRVIHGVAGSGKTIILGYRCLYLSTVVKKPILVLCFNISLATRLKRILAEKGVANTVHVYHFHDWCGQQLKTYHVDIIKGDAPLYERNVLSVIKAVENGEIPRAQYGALLIDEGHDFEPEWLRLVTQMIDPKDDSLLLLYDDAQSIYKTKKPMDFSLSSVGIQARGRTTILHLNYRNTHEILELAYHFVKGYLADNKGSDIPVIKPEQTGKNGVIPALKHAKTAQQEIDYIVHTLQTWRSKNKKLSDMAIIYPNQSFGRRVAEALRNADVDFYWLKDKANKKNFDLTKPVLLTRHSSKGLEFKTVILCGIGVLNDKEEARVSESKLLYVAMTRAKEELMICTHGDNFYVKQLKGLPEFYRAC